MPGCLFGAPDHNVLSTATLSWTVSSEDSDYPLTNLTGVLALESDQVAKAAASTATLRATFDDAQALEGILAINTNWAGLTVALTNNGGMATQNRTFVNPGDGLQINGWWDLRDVAGASATQWNIAVTSAPDQVTIGALLLVSSWDAFKIRWGYRIGHVRPVISHRTSHQKRLTYRIPVKYRTFTGEAFWSEDRDGVRALHEQTHGSHTPFAFIPDVDDPDAFLVQFTEDPNEETYEFHQGSFEAATATGITPMPIHLEEVNAGVTVV